MAFSLLDYPVHTLVGDLVFRPTNSSMTSADGLLPYMETGNASPSLARVLITVLSLFRGRGARLQCPLGSVVCRDCQQCYDSRWSFTYTRCLPNQRSFAVTNLPSDADIILEAFLDTNGNGDRDNFLRSLRRIQWRQPLKVGVGGRFNIVLDLSNALTHRLRND